MSHHKVRVHDWINGQLSWKDVWFSTLEDASMFVEDLICDTWKIFDTDDIVVNYGNGCKEIDEEHEHDHRHHHRHRHHRHEYSDGSSDEFDEDEEWDDDSNKTIIDL